MVGVESTMQMRANIQRYKTIGADDYGQPIKDYVIVGLDVPCRIWHTKITREENETTTVYKDVIKGIFFQAADITKNDKLTEVKDRCGNMLWKNLQVNTNPMQKVAYKQVELVSYD